MTQHFTFFESYYSAVKDLDSEIKAEFYEAIFEYALYDESPSDGTNPIVKALFNMAKPNLDSSKAKREAGKQGGSKAKQSESKAKQSESEKEKEKEKEEKTKAKKEFFVNSVFSERELNILIKYRADIKKSIKTQQAATGLSNSFKQCYEKGYQFEELMNLMAEKQWVSLKLEWVEQELRNHSNKSQENKSIPILDNHGNIESYANIPVAVGGLL